MSCFAVRRCILFFFCLWTHPLSFSLRLPKHEASSSPLKSFDRKSKLPRTSSTARVSSDDELLNRERSFWRRTPQSIKITHMFPYWCVCVYRCVCKYPPLIWLTGAVSGVPGLSAPSQSSSGSVTSSPAQRSELPAWRPEPSAGRRSPPASPGPEQQGWVRTGLQQGAEQWVRASQGQNKTESLESPGTNEGKTFASRTFKGLLNHT